MSVRWRVAAVVVAIVLATGVAAWFMMVAVDRDAQPRPAATMLR